MLTQGNDLLDEHDVAVASVGSGRLVHARHRAFQELLCERRRAIYVRSLCLKTRTAESSQINTPSITMFNGCYNSNAKKRLEGRHARRAGVDGVGVPGLNQDPICTGGSISVYALVASGVFPLFNTFIVKVF